MDSEATLVSLQGALTQFFDAATGAEQKRQIETQLCAFKQDPGAWKHVFHFFSNSSDANLLWYAASVWEEQVDKRWSAMAPQEQQQMRDFLHQYLVARFVSLPKFVSTKVAVVLVNIAKLDWPERYTNFLTQVVACMPTVPSLGLTLLHTLLEELVAGAKQRVITAQRRRLLCDQLAVELPTVLSVLVPILQGGLSNQVASRCVLPFYTHAMFDSP
jgi:hypothetical protein